MFYALLVSQHRAQDTIRGVQIQMLRDIHTVYMYYFARTYLCHIVDGAKNTT